MSALKAEKKVAVPTSALKSFLSGGFGGMSLIAAGYPFDLVKVRIQTSSLYRGTWDCLSRTIQADGVLGLYRGMLAPIVAATPVFALNFLGYNMGQRLAVELLQGQKTGSLTTNQILFAGGFSAIPGTLLMAPMERIKCLLQVSGQGGVSYKGPLDAVVSVYKASGIRGLYTGSALTLLRDIPGSTTYFACYELLKRIMIPEGTPREKVNPLTVIVAGGLAGIARWTVAIVSTYILLRLSDMY
ncbi:Mitochondrial carnitine/acylcarnitine carrier protein [Zancudomyces culisetae]|uniref:Mitochondrial carnitine/acylcarnitine carrier protein n=1 Tax=Zancudomyces culisetae TaxID=1213189 RepID=A0A1R1PWS2_ZANCU|nr:Mitochondrial carnitine/acylcarnitine carrier protein [Zancudomyces culisetae]|eukprot:OMH85333.1 Mitochondrial carnitine/acylcarnitine carrier protein [Zancudomyces culisetae]